MVKEDFKKRNPDNKPINKEEFIMTYTSISYIDLSEGILPSALYMLYCIYFDEVNNM